MGAEHIVLRQIDGTEILRRVEQYGVTLMCAAPAVVNAALDAAPDWDGEIPGRGRVRIVCAGAPPPTRTIERLLNELGWEFCQIYGLTETSPLRDHQPAAGRVGRPRPARAGPPARCGPGPRLSGAGRRSTPTARSSPRRTTTSRATGSSRRRPPRRTARRAARAGQPWFHTGDGGYLDDDGYLVISDRKKDVIISGGENVSSIEVEDALISHPGVKEAAVIGIPDEKWGELVTGLVVRDGRRGHGRGTDRALPAEPGRLQVPEADRVRRRAAPHRHRQAAEVQAAPAVLGGPRPPDQLTATARTAPMRLPTVDDVSAVLVRPRPRLPPPHRRHRQGAGVLDAGRVPGDLRRGPRSSRTRSATAVGPSAIWPWVRPTSTIWCPASCWS